MNRKTSIFIYLLIGVVSTFFGINSVKADFNSSSCVYVRKADFAFFNSDKTTVQAVSTLTATKDSNQQANVITSVVSVPESKIPVVGWFVNLWTGVAKDLINSVSDSTKVFKVPAATFKATGIQTFSDNVIMPIAGVDESKSDCAPFLVIAVMSDSQNSANGQMATVAYSKDAAINDYTKAFNSATSGASYYPPYDLPREEFTKDSAFILVEILDHQITLVNADDAKPYESKLGVDMKNVDDKLYNISCNSITDNSTLNDLYSSIDVAKTDYYYDSTAITNFASILESAKIGHPNYDQAVTYFKKNGINNSLIEDNLSKSIDGKKTYCQYIDNKNDFQKQANDNQTKRDALNCPEDQYASMSEPCKKLFDEKREIEQQFAIEDRKLDLTPAMAAAHTKLTGVILTDSSAITCDDFNEENGNNLLDEIFLIIEIVAPLLVIFLGMGDFIKAFASSEAAAMKKAASNFGKRLAAAVLLFLLPFIVNILLQWALDSGIFGYSNVGTKPQVCVEFSKQANK